MQEKNLWLTYLIDHGIEVLTALIIAVIGLLFANYIRRRLITFFKKHIPEQILTHFIVNVVYVLTLVILGIIVLSKIGIPTSSLLTILGASGLAIALALRDSLSNVASGIILVFIRPFKVGDFIEVNRITGRVKKINLFNTQVVMPNNEVVFIPNSKVINDNIINKTHDTKRRLELNIAVSYDCDIKIIRNLLEAIYSENNLILQEPKPFTGISEFGDNSIKLTIRCWVNSLEYNTVKFNLLECIKNEFDEKGIVFPFPQLDVHLDK